MRKIIIHYHFFKNAGTSIDRVLEQNFGDQWHAFDDHTKRGRKFSTEELEQVIQDHPNMKAFSSHQIVPPLPMLQGIQVFPIFILRHPIERIKSCYLFEYGKQKGLKYPKVPFSNYIEDKWNPKGRGVLQNFQVNRLGSFDRSNPASINKISKGELYEKAENFLATLEFFGIVDRFDESLALLSHTAQKHFPDFHVSRQRANSLQDVSVSMEDRISGIRQELDEELYEKVLNNNLLDLKLYNFAQKQFSKLLKQENLVSGE